MSSFEDIETQNGRRLTIYGKSKVAGFYADHVRDYRTAFCIDDEHARAAGVSGAGSSAPLRRPRTALGFGLLGPVAPPAFSVGFRPNGPRTYDPSSLRLTMPDGTVFTGDALYVERDT